MEQSHHSAVSPKRMGYGDVLVHQRGGPRFRKHRRIVQDSFSTKSLANYASLQRKEVYTTLVDIGNSPNYLDRHLKRYDHYTGISIIRRFDVLPIRRFGQWLVGPSGYSIGLTCGLTTTS